MPSVEAPERGKRRRIAGLVVSDKMDKTVVVEVSHRLLHPVYKKFVVRAKRYQAHDEQNLCKPGDRVQIEECRPISKHKRWRVIETLEKALEV